MSESNYDDFENYNDVVSRWACQTMITLFLEELVKLW